MKSGPAAGNDQNQGVPRHFGAIIRHGEAGLLGVEEDVARGDSDESSEEDPENDRNPLDPPLTPDGLIQANATGAYLKEYFSENGYKFDEIIIECSPFLSCMMTAGQIASALKCENVTINYRASKLIRASMAKNPISKLEWTKYGFNFKLMQCQNIMYSTESRYFPKNVNFHEAPRKDHAHKAYMFQPHPETKHQSQGRTLSLLELMNARMEFERKSSDKKVCFLIVSHSTQVDEAAHIFDFVSSNSASSAIRSDWFEDIALDVKEKLLSSVDYYTNVEDSGLDSESPGFCSISGFEIKGRTMVSTFLKRHQSHLKGLSTGKLTKSGQTEKGQIEEKWRHWRSGADSGSYQDVFSRTQESALDAGSPESQKAAKLVLVIKVSSAGRIGGDFAEITINDLAVQLERNENRHFRGLNLVLINPETGKIELAKAFDTYKTSKGLDAFILGKNAPHGTIVAAACKDDCSTKLSEEAKKWFAKMGSEEIWNLDYRQGFAFIGKIGKGKVIEKRA